ncbi:6,7-dimethyl-8-ribityllumazine synthase [Neptunomonas phycophila]|uniref:6,7-dimethyl-8-ribityllumazine synthase n=1 Tax=Neptunomonas phycophila TaxID=1572645 RepID=UPI003513C39C
MNQSSTNSNTLNIRDQRIAFIHASWHTDIVLNCWEGFRNEMAERGYDVDKFDLIAVPGAYEIPLQAKLLAKTGRYAAIACSALVVDGGIYRHDFVAQAVVDGLVRVGLDTDVPVLSVSLTPHSYQETDFHNAAFAEHFVKKGREAANAALQIVKTRAAIKGA